MTRYCKTRAVEATQWFKNGDHPEDDCGEFIGSDGKPFQGEGHVVRYYRHPEDSGKRICTRCEHTMHNHGWIDVGENGRYVCPGDWIITATDGQYYPCKTDLFEVLSDA